MARRALVFLLVLAVVSPATPGAASGSGDEPWATSICQGLRRWESDLGRLSGGSIPTDPATAKRAVVHYLTGALRATDELSNAVRNAGTPNITHGPAIVHDILAAIAPVRSAFATAARSARKLPTNDATAFANGTRSIAANLGAAPSTLDTTLARLSTHYGPALGKTFAHAKACRSLA